MIRLIFQKSITFIRVKNAFIMAHLNNEVIATSMLIA